MMALLIVLYSLSLIFGFAAVFLKTFRLSVFSIWLSGIILGVTFLLLGGEWLALLQWLISCSVGILFLVFGTVTGEAEIKVSNPANRRGLILASLGTLMFGGMLGLALMGLVDWGGEFKAQDTTAAQIGLALVRTHPLTVFVLGFLAVISIIGIGTMTRADWKRGDWTP